MPTRSHIPKGFKRSAQGSDVPRRSTAEAEARATLGQNVRRIIYPGRVSALSAKRPTTHRPSPTSPRHPLCSLLRPLPAAILLALAPPHAYSQAQPPNALSQESLATATLIAHGAKLQELAGGLQFGEGPAADAEGNVFFSDIPASRTLKWSLDGKLSTFRTDTGNANGQCFDRDGNLIACEGGRGRLAAVNKQGQATVVIAEYQGKRFNQPNDLWVDSNGGIYFSDPIYGRGTRTQAGEYVYYLKPDRKTVMPVITDFVRPNGLVGTPDGKMLYASDHGARKVYAYDINSDGSLANKRFFAPVAADGMTIDNAGNLYLCEDAVLIYDPSGKKLGTIELPEQPTNVCFGGRDAKTLFITTRPKLYSLRTHIGGTAKSNRPLKSPEHE